MDDESRTLIVRDYIMISIGAFAGGFHGKSSQLSMHHKIAHKSRPSKLVGRHVMILLFLFIGLISIVLMLLLIQKDPPNKSVHVPIHGQFAILKSESSLRKNHVQNLKLNPLRRSFEWYRDHWSDIPSSKHAFGVEPNTTKLPEWMTEYFEWHKSNLNDPNARYLIVQCLEQDRQCGGLADRLLPLPFLVLLAATNQRLLIIIWTIPFPLEEFFSPNLLDWRMASVPNLLTNESKILNAPSIKDKTVYCSIPKLVEAAKDESLRIVRARIQDYATAWSYYDEYPHINQHFQMGPSPAQLHYRDLFFSLFGLSPPVQQAMQQRQEASLPSATSYAVAHYRALYGSNSPSSNFIQWSAKNAANCASQLRPEGPIVVLSDSLEALTSLKEYKVAATVTPLFSINKTAPLHLDKATRKQTTIYKPSEFYDTFLDIMVMANAECVSYGQGGFGKLGSLLSRNASCNNRHFENGRIISCSRKRG